jgi:hypothetical protein
MCLLPFYKYLDGKVDFIPLRPVKQEPTSDQKNISYVDVDDPSPQTD